MNKELYALKCGIEKYRDESFKRLVESDASLPMKDHGGEFSLSLKDFFKLGVESHIKLSDNTHFFKVSLPKGSWVNGLGFRLSSFEVVSSILDSYLVTRTPAFLINLEVSSSEH